MLQYIEYLGVPTSIAIALVALFLVSQVIGEVLELCGKVVPEFIKVRKYFHRKRDEKNESTQMLREMKQLLQDVNAHYSEDNIMKRNSWMQWVNERADVYDSSIVEISANLNGVAEALQANTEMTVEMFIQSSRDRIIDFATKCGDEHTLISKEEFNRIFKVYDKYEKFLEEHDLTNGEVDVAHRIINDAFEYRIRHHSFVEDIRGYHPSQE